MSIAQFMICGDFEGICNLNFSVILRPFSEAIQISSASNSDLLLMSSEKYIIDYNHKAYNII